jgi:hypothetical protein
VGLTPLPAGFASTREALHRVAERILAAARKPDNEIALAQTPGGFGTPPFEFEGRALQVRVDRAVLAVAEDGTERRRPLSSLADAAEFVGADLFLDGVPDDDSTLAIDPEAARVLGEFYDFAARALQALLATTAPADDSSAINLWPEHFDLAFESGPEALGRRATYGASPGDGQHAAPYLYVGPWQDQGGGELWNATSFHGAELDHAELVAAEDPDGLAARFFTVHREALAD